MAASEIQKKQWPSVMTLAAGASILSTTGYIPIALLNGVGKSFNVSPIGVGVMITVYTWIAALLSLLLMLTTGNFERRRLLLVLFALFTVDHTVSLLAWNFEILLFNHIRIALTHAALWSTTASLVVRVALQGRGSQALGLLSTDTVTVVVVGIPLGRAIGQYFSRQVSLLPIGAYAVAVMMTLAKDLPLLLSRNNGPLSSLPILLEHRDLMTLYALTVLVITVHFMAYSYAEPFVLQTGGFQSEQVALVLGLHGLAGFSVSHVFGRQFTKFPCRFPTGSVGVIMSATPLLLPSADYTPTVYTLCFIWGMTVSIVDLGIVLKMLNFTSGVTDMVSPIYSGLYNAGVGGGTLLGCYVTVWFGLSTIGVAGALLAAMTSWLCWLLVGRGGFMGKIESDKDQVPV